MESSSSTKFTTKKYKQSDKQSWIRHGKKLHKIIVFYGTDVLDFTQFAEVHPGGKKVIQKYMFTDVKDILLDICPMKKSSVASLACFKIGTIFRQAKEQRKSLEVKKLQLMKENKRRISESIARLKMSRPSISDSMMTLMAVTVSKKSILSSWANSGFEEQKNKQNEQQQQELDEKKPPIFIRSIRILTKNFSSN